MIAIPIVIALLVIGGWALLAGLPYGGPKKLTRTQQPEPSVISEQEPRSTATISEIQVPAEQPAPRRPAIPATVAAAAKAEQAQRTTPPPAPRETPPKVSIPTETPAPTATSAADHEISEDEAVNVLRGYVTSRDYYGLGPTCAGMAGQGYSNAGYTIDVVDRCGDRGRLGRWRVDAKTREVFVQRKDGRYLRP
jgi:hypothetical protein